MVNFKAGISLRSSVFKGIVLAAVSMMVAGQALRMIV